MPLNIDPTALILLVFAALGVISHNAPVIIASTLLLLVQQTPLTRYLPWMEKNGVSLGIILLTIGVLSPLASGKVTLGMADFGNWKVLTAMGVGVIVAWLGGRGVTLMLNQPGVVPGLIVGTVIGGIGTWRLGLFGGDDDRTPSTAAGGHGSDRASSASHKKDREKNKDGDKDDKDSAKDRETDRDEPTPAEEEPDRDSPPAPVESSEPDSGSGSGASGSNGAGSADYVTPCARAPQFAVRSVSDQGGELEVTTEVTPSCSEGDVLTGAANSIALYAPSSTTGSGAADMVVAYADFDFSGSPVVIPSGGRTLVLRFGAGYFFRSASDISAGSATISGDIDRSGASTAVVVGSDASTTAIVASGTGDGQVAEADAAGNLRWQADHDRPTVVSSVSGYWVPQVSSKRPGLYAEGMTWGSPDIVQEFFSLRQQFPQALLLFSDDWPVFDAGGSWWVTIVGIPFTTAEEANAWCDSQGLDGEHCFAKYIDTNGSSEGTTRNR